MTMLDPTTLPIILKVLDFIFGEGSKILEERRDRLKNNPTQASKENAVADATRSSDKTIQTKSDALENLVSESDFKSAEREITHLLNLREIYLKRYELAKEKLAIFGKANVPFQVMAELDEAESEISNVINQLSIILSKVYGKDIVISNFKKRGDITD